MVHEGRFRQDLYFRIARVVLEVPPLRERPEDIAALAQHFLRERRADAGQARALGRRVRPRSARYAWPGNVRELRNVVSAAAARRLGDDRSRRARARARPGRCGLGLRADSDELRRAVEQHGGNLAAAARTLGVARSTLRDRVKRC